MRGDGVCTAIRLSRQFHDHLLRYRMRNTFIHGTLNNIICHFRRASRAGHREVERMLKRQKVDSRKEIEAMKDMPGSVLEVCREAAIEGICCIIWDSWVYAIRKLHSGLQTCISRFGARSDRGFQS
jgi:hypothetical protein